jgi:hypothetical protein
MRGLGRTLPDITSEATFRSTWQREMRTPVVTSIFLLVTVFFVVFLVEARFGVPLWPMGLALTLVWSAIYYAVFYLLYWRVMRALVRRNIPLLLIFLGYFSVLALTEFAIGPLYLPVAWTWDRAVWYFSTSIAVFPAATAICMLFYERALRAGFATFPEALPYWQPVPERIDRLSHHLPAAKRGRLRRIEARNQYVESTPARGPHILRMKLSEAVAAPAGDGLQVHRSLWLAEAEIRDLIYVDGNPKVVDADGALWSAGRKKVPEIRAVIVKNQAA